MKTKVWNTYNFSNNLSLLCTCDALFALYLNLSINTYKIKRKIIIHRQQKKKGQQSPRIDGGTEDNSKMIFLISQ